MTQYDIIIAGSGLGGLECAAILSKEGYNVCVLEKNHEFGGCLQTFSRKGHLFDTGIHYVGSLGEGQVLNQVFKYMDIMDKLKLIKLDLDRFDIIDYQGKHYNYAMGYDAFVDTLSKDFPAERDAIKNYTDDLKNVGSLIGVDLMKQGHIAKSGMKHFYESAEQVISKHTDNPTLRNVLAASCMLYGGIKHNSNFYLHGMINNSYIEGAYRFVDGSEQIAKGLIDEIRKNGGTVRNRSEVTKLHVKEDVVSAVEVNGEETLTAKYYISNIHPQRTLELLEKNKIIKNAYITRVNSLENSFGTFSLYLVMKKDSQEYFNYNYYIHDTDDVWFNPRSGYKNITSALLSCQKCSESDYADVVNVIVPIEFSLVEKWKDTFVGKRGDDYKEFKENLTTMTLNLLKDKGYDFTHKIESIYTATPLTYRDYTASVNGAAYGIIKDYRFPEKGLISTRSKLRNLFFTGQNMNAHGALGVTLTALFTCADFLGQEYIAKKIGNA